SAGKTKGDFSSKSRKVLIEEKLATKSEFEISTFAKEINVEEGNLIKILTMMIKKGSVNASIKAGKFIPS
ncbi:MAG: hypothetical protein ACXAC2_16770, partial [Candidatus Kariarchaeaceae archaeon]